MKIAKYYKNTKSNLLKPCCQLSNIRKMKVLLLLPLLLSLVSSYKLLVPFYISPTINLSTKTCSESNWIKLANGAPAGSVIIMNPNNGPINSTSAEFNSWQICMNLLISKNLTLIGYVHSKNSYLDPTTQDWVQTGFRSLNDIANEVALWKNSYRQISGIFLDEVSNIWLPDWDSVKTDHLNFYATIYKTIKYYNANWKVFLNPGGPFFEEYLQNSTYKAGENAVLFENDISSWNNSCLVFGKGPFCVFQKTWDGVDSLRNAVLLGAYSVSAMIYGIPTTSSAAGDLAVLNVARQNKIEYIFMTDNVPWNAMPGKTLWDTQRNN